MKGSPASRIARVTEALRRPAPLTSDRAFLALALVLALGSVLSWRYHFFFQNYSPFVVQRVLPQAGGLGLLQRAVGERADRDHPEKTRLDVYPFNSPLFMNREPIYGEQVVPVASDFLALWHFLQVVYAGADPYRNIGWLVYNEEIERAITIRNPGVPPQFIHSGMSYFPGGPWLVAPFSSDNYLASLARYLVTFKLFLVAAAALLVRRAAGHRAALAAFFACLYFTCGPVDMMVDRGNIEGIVFMLVAGFYAAYTSGRFRLAAVLLAVAATAKLFPALLFVLFFHDRRYRELALGAVTLGALMLLGLLTFNAPIPVLLTELRHNLGVFGATVSFRFSHSLYTLLTAGLFPESALHDGAAVHVVQKVYPVLAVGLMGALLWRTRVLDFADRALLLTVAMLLLPKFVGHYSLIHLLAPLSLVLLRMARRERPAARDLALALLVCLVFVSKEYLVGFFRFHWGVGVIVNPLLLIGVLAVGWVRPLNPSEGAAAPAP